jgi:hypothetical protein
MSPSPVKACARGSARFWPVVSSAEDLDVPPGYFELIVIGNAFHRLRRELVARLAYDWVKPGGLLALCWSSGTQAGSLDWQRAFGDLLRRWAAALGCGDRVPANWDLARKERPDADVLSGAGFELAGRFEFLVEHIRLRSGPQIVLQRCDVGAGDAAVHEERGCRHE